MTNLSIENREIRKKVYFVFVIVVMIYTSVLLHLYNHNDKKVFFEYIYSDGKKYISNDCYISNDICYCKRNGGYVNVDSFYIEQ